MSFAQEIKDFLSAAQAGQKILGAKDDAEYKRARTRHLTAQTNELEDPETKRLSRAEKEARVANTQANTAHTRAATARANDATDIELNREAKRAAIGASNSRSSFYNAQQDAVRRMSQPAVGGETPPEFAPRTPVQPQPAIPTTPGEDLEEGVRTPMMANGGLVQKFADGGMVEEATETSEDDGDDDDVVAPAIGGSSSDTEMSSQSRRGFSHEAAYDAVNDGLKYNLTQFGLDQKNAVPTSTRARSLQSYARGAGAAPVADMNAVRKAIDPEGKMSESERNLAAFSSVYQFQLNRGNPEGAKRAAAAMLQHYRLAAQRYAAIASAAAENGNVDAAARYAMKSYANVPDGKDLKVTKDAKGRLSYSIVDERSGKTITQGIATPEELAGAAQGMASNGFDQFLLTAAGERAGTSKGKKGAVGSDGGSVRSRQASEESIDGAWSKFEAGEGAPKIPSQDKKEFTAIANRLFRSNDQMTSDEALNAVMRLATPNPKNPGAVDYELKRAEGGGATVTFKNGASVNLDPESFQRVMFLRAEKAKGLTPKDGEDKPGILSRISDFASDKASAVGNYLSEVRENNAKAIREGAASRGKKEPEQPPETDWDRNFKRQAIELANQKP